MYKILLSFLFLSMSFADGPVGNRSFDRDYKLFETECFDANGDSKQDAYVDEIFTSCEDLSKYLRNEIVLYEDNYLRDGISETVSPCLPPEIDPVADLTGKIEDVTSKVQCSNAERLKTEKSCGESWNCNKYRSFIHGTAKLPDFITDKVKSYGKRKAKENRYGPNCLKNDQSNCLEEFVTSIAGSFWSTVTSVWDLVKTGASSLWDATGWFSKKSESLHTAAKQNSESVTSFMDDPGKWFSDFLDKVKLSVDGWIKGTVMCQKWEGRPHFSKCETPLESLDCMDCDDKLNATCAGIGAITSEVGLMFLTAGVGNVASISAKVGASTMRLVAQNAATKIKLVAPNLGKSTKISKKVSDNKVVKAAVATAKVAKGVASFTAAKLAKAKDKIKDFIHVVEETAVAKAVTKVIDLTTDPLRISTTIAKAGVNASNKVVAKVATGQAKRRARVGIKVHEKSKRNTNVNDILKRRDNHVGKRATAKGSYVGKAYRKSRSKTPPKGGGDKAITSKTKESNIPKETSSNPSPKTAQTSTSKQVSKKQASEVGRDQFAPSHDKPQHHSTNQQNKNTNNKKGKDKDKLASESSEKKSTHHEEGDDNSKKGSNAGRLLGAAAIADVANKVKNSSDVSDIFVGASGSDSSSDKIDREAMLSALNIKDGQSMSQEQISSKANSLAEVYSEQNREQVVNRLQEKSPGMSRDQANQAFSKRQQQIKSAQGYLSSQNKSVAQAAPRRDVFKESKISELNNKKKDLDNLIENLKNDTTLEDLKKNAGKKVVRNAPVKEATKSSNRRARASSPQGRVAASSGGVSSGGGFSGGSGGGLGQSSGGVSSSSQGSSTPAENKAEVGDVKMSTEEGVVPEAQKPLSMTEMLKLAEHEDVQILTDVKFAWRIKDVEALSSTAKKSLSEFAELVESKSIARTKMKYSGKDSYLEVYEFSNGKKYSFLIDVDKNVELIPESRTGDIIQRFVSE